MYTCAKVCIYMKRERERERERELHLRALGEVALRILITRYRAKEAQATKQSEGPEARAR